MKSLYEKPECSIFFFRRVDMLDSSVEFFDEKDVLYPQKWY